MFESVYKAKKVVDMAETNQLAAAGWLLYKGNETT
jgi:hypothetical protein